MRILIVSDTHRRHEYLKWTLGVERPIDRMIHLGDVEGYEIEIAKMAGCPVNFVAGNNDFFSLLPREEEIMLGRYRALLTHGHYYYVNVSAESIKREAYGRRCDIVMYGHTHRPLIDQSGDVIALNPGSISYPRQEGRRPSYIIMDVDEKGEASFELRYVTL